MKKKKDVTSHWYSACDEHLKVMQKDAKKIGKVAVYCEDTEGFKCGFFPKCKKKAKWEVYFLEKEYDFSKMVPFEV